MEHIPHFLTSSLLTLVCFTFSNIASGESSINEWQMKRLMQPNQGDLQREQQGHVMIYHGLTDKTVGAAMNKHFDRIGAMMFTGTVITDVTGEPVREPDTGEVLTEDDGCD